jgi:DNA-binding MarR family transcriptional regulator
VTSAAASHIVERLVAREHAQRRPHRTDGRRVEVLLTESGRREVLSHLLPMLSALADLDAGLTERERTVVYEYLTGATAAMRRLL